MLLDDRRIVLALEAVCWITALLVFLDHTDLPAAMAVIPAMLGVIIRIEYPPPGSGVGKPADALPGLRFEDEKQRPALGADGALLPGHAYVLTFLRKTPGALKHMPRMHRLASGCANVRKTVHFVAITPEEDGAAQARGRKASKAGKATDALASALAPALDTTKAAWMNYMHKHGAMTMPHVFVVDGAGTILWHGQCNRRGLVPAIKKVVGQVDPKNIVGGKGE